MSNLPNMRTLRAVADAVILIPRLAHGYSYVITRYELQKNKDIKLAHFWCYTPLELCGRMALIKFGDVNRVESVEEVIVNC